MNDFEKKKCLEITNKLFRMELCRPFKDKVDPVRDGALDYFQVVKKPMDLTTIRKKLTGNDYKSSDAWASDVRQVWTNAMLYNKEGTLLYIIAQEMEIWFRRKYDTMPRNKDEEWMAALRKSTRKMHDLSLHPPSSIVTCRQMLGAISPLQQAGTSDTQMQGSLHSRAGSRPPSTPPASSVTSQPLSPLQQDDDKTDDNTQESKTQDTTENDEEPFDDL